MKQESPLHILRTLTSTMAEMPPRRLDSLLRRRSLSSMAYTNCTTRIVDLTSVGIEERGTDNEYRHIYQQYTQSTSETTQENRLNLRDAIESIKHGIAPPVAFPTETVYGLGADATSEPAVAGIFAAKGRPSDNPLIVHVSSTEHLERAIEQPIPEIYKPVIEKFWPGPLTILSPVPKESKFAKNVYPGQNTIGFRMPSSKYARFFIAATDRPIAGPSANSSGKPSPTTAHHVLDDLQGKINFILDGGPCQVGIESTVVDGLHDPPLILRPGGVSREDLIEIGGKWAETALGYDTHSPSHVEKKDTRPEQGLHQNGSTDTNGAPRAPGMKYRHYCPTARLILFTPTARKSDRMQQMFDTLPKPPGKTGKIRIAFLDRSWGLRAGLEINEDGDGGSFEQTVKDLDVDLEPWDPYWRDGGCIHTETHIIFNLSVSKQNPTKGTITELARELFHMLRFFDALDCDYIFAETVELNETLETDGRFVEAVADRLNKAATERIET